MSVIIHKNTNVLVQGITGKEGQKATQSMMESGIKVSAGVTPGKGGQEVLGKPVFDTIEQALAFDPTINTSVLYVPPMAVLSAALEAMEGGIKTLVIVSENVPVKDSVLIFERSKQLHCRVLGPSSVGVLDTRLGKLGSIGNIQGSSVYKEGNIGIISKSGGMCSETALVLTQAGLGQSTVVGIGGDTVICSNFVDILELFEADSQTHAVVLFGEIGGFYENQVAQMVKNKKFTKPIVAFISGQFAEKLGRNLALGHAGAIIEGSETTAKAKKRILRKAGISVADYHYEIPELVKQSLA